MSCFFYGSQCTYDVGKVRNLVRSVMRSQGNVGDPIRVVIL